MPKIDMKTTIASKVFAQTGIPLGGLLDAIENPAMMPTLTVSQIVQSRYIGASNNTNTTFFRFGRGSGGIKASGVPFTRSILHAAPRGGVGQLVGDPPGPSGGAHRVARTPRSASRGDWCAHDGRCVRSINARPEPIPQLTVHIGQK